MNCWLNAVPRTTSGRVEPVEICNEAPGRKYWKALVSVTGEPPDIETLTSTGPAVWTGVVTVALVVELTTTEVAETPPNVTVSDELVGKFAPVTKIVVPPVVG